MKNTSLQRILKVERAGDYYRGKTYSKLRIQGKWLEDCGFKSMGHAFVQSLAKGELHIKYINSKKDLETL
jgi:hypothetical protein